MPQLSLVQADTTLLDWLPLAGILAFYWGCVLLLLVFGRHRSKMWFIAFFERIGDSLERVTGLPGWAASGILSGLAFLLIAVIGLYWDVAWHIDLGRDRNLFTPAHVMILVGLGGLVYAAIVSMIFATVQRADVGPRSFEFIRIPWSSLPLLFLGAGAFLAFPVDAAWHNAFGLDVTLWSPPHLQLLTGGAAATFAVWLMLAEARRHSNLTGLGRFIHLVVAGATLVAMSTYQGEFDFGVPQFQLLFLPLLVVGAAALVLVPARVALGPGGAVGTVAVYIVLRLVNGVLVTQAFGLSTGGGPIYIGAAVCVEVVALMLGTDRRLRYAAAAGLAIGTVGLVPEVAWLHALGWPLATDLLPKVAILCPLLAVAMAVLGAGLSRAFSPGAGPVGAGALLGAAAVAIGVLAFPLPRTVGSVNAVVTLVDRSGDTARVGVQLDPPDAAEGATLFGVTAWQGGGRQSSGFTEVSPGTYLSDDAVSVGGPWKTIVGLERGDEVMSAAVAMPLESSVDAPPILPVAVRHEPFVRNTDLTLRETHDGPGEITLLGWGSLATWLAVWVGFLVLAAWRLAAGAAESGAGGARPAESRSREWWMPPDPAYPTPAVPLR